MSEPAGYPGQGYHQPAYRTPVYGPPVSAVPQSPPGMDLQPYSPAYPQPYGPAYPPAPATAHPLVSAGGRFGAALLDGLLALFTLYLGWLIWSLFTWADGQTPAKKLLGHVVIDARTGRAFGWGEMAVREFLIKGLLGWLLNMLTFSVYFLIDSFMVFGDRQRTLHDRMVNSVVRHS
jgi:uncharacterized RDD family membrane protein YckC